MKNVAFELMWSNVAVEPHPPREFHGALRLAEKAQELPSSGVVKAIGKSCTVDFEVGDIVCWDPHVRKDFGAFGNILGVDAIKLWIPKDVFEEIDGLSAPMD